MNFVINKETLNSEIAYIISEAIFDIQVLTERYRDNMTLKRMNEINKLKALTDVRVSERRSIISALSANEVANSYNSDLTKSIEDLFFKTNLLLK